MSGALAQVAPATDLLDVFSSLNGSSFFQGLTAGVAGQPSILGRIGWIFTSFGAVFVLWGFVLRTRNTHGGDKLTEIVRTLLLFAAMMAGPMAMRTAMQGADRLYASAIGGPADLALTCAKAAYAMPEVTALFDLLRQSPIGAAGTVAAAPGSPAAAAYPAADGTVFGYLAGVGATFWQALSHTAATVAVGWSGALRLLGLANGLGAAAMKCVWVTGSCTLLYLLLLIAAAIAWVMEQLRYFFAVTGTMMLPLFLGLFSLPEGHPNRGPAHAYVMHLLSLALWPVAWAIGHTGTIAFYNVLIALISGTSRVPAIAELLQWSSITANPSPSAAQLHGFEAALGNWFMGDWISLLGLVVVGMGFMLWVLAVSVLGPMFLHKLLTTGALFMSQAVAGSARLGVGAVRTAASVETLVGARRGASLASLRGAGGKGSGALEGSAARESGPALPSPLRSGADRPESPAAATMDRAAASLAAPASNGSGRAPA